MLHAKKPAFWRNRYEITADGQPIATWDGSMWRNGGRFELDGLRYEVRGNMWGSRYGMAAEDGSPVAAADRVGRKKWTVEAAGRNYEFRRASMWRHEEELLSGGRSVGSVRRTSVWRSDATADLPELPLPVQIFVLVVVLTTWDGLTALASVGAFGGASH
jgi:hypothetical protein